MFLLGLHTFYTAAAERFESASHWINWADSSKRFVSQITTTISLLKIIILICILIFVSPQDTSPLHGCKLTKKIMFIW